MAKLYLKKITPPFSELYEIIDITSVNNSIILRRNMDKRISLTHIEYTILIMGGRVKNMELYIK